MHATCSGAPLVSPTTEISSTVVLDGSYPSRSLGAQQFNKKYRTFSKLICSPTHTHDNLGPPSNFTKLAFQRHLSGFL
jgi:hypothetical protein